MTAGLHRRQLLGTAAAATLCAPRIARAQAQGVKIGLVAVLTAMITGDVQGLRKSPDGDGPAHLGKTEWLPLSLGTYALVSETVEVDVNGPDWGYVFDDLVGEVKVRSVSDEPVFVGIAPAGYAAPSAGNKTTRRERHGTHDHGRRRAV